MEDQLRERLASVRGLDLHKHDWPDAPLTSLTDDDQFDAFVDALIYVAIRRATGPAAMSSQTR